MKKGKIQVTTENIFPIIKKFLYSDHEIFLRELISNSIDATQKLKTLASVGDYKGDITNLIIKVSLDKNKKTLTVSDHGIGMTAEEIDKYINQIAFSSAEEFMEKYKKHADEIIGHFGLGFYSAFMVSEKVEILTKSYKKGAKPVKWVCDGSPEFSIEEIKKEEIGTDVIIYFDNESKEFVDDLRIYEILRKYCKFLPIEIAFGKETEFKDGKTVETAQDRIINDTKPAWTRKPSELKDEDYKKFYNDLYPALEEPLFNIHLNVDYPFNLTGILYFPKIKSNFEIQKNKIQLYANQVFVTDSVEDIVPEFLTLLHGVLDSPDIPLNISRSFLQNDPNVKKISAHITKKVADKLDEIFKNDRSEFEKKWDHIKLFIEFGMLSEEKFYDKAQKFALLKNTDDKYFTFEEYEKIIKENQTDKNKNLIYLYSTDSQAQYTFIENAKSKGYDVLLMDGQLDSHFINQLEQKYKDSRFLRVDADVIDKLIQKEEIAASKLSSEQQNDLSSVFKSQLPEESNFFVVYESLDEKGEPMLITQSEYMRRMKDMSKMGGGAMDFYGKMPDNFNLVVNTNHPLVSKILNDKDKSIGEKLKKFNNELKPLNTDLSKLREEQDKKKDDEKEKHKNKIEDLEKKAKTLNAQKEKILSDYGKKNKLVKQLIDLALLSNNMLKGEALTKFIKRSAEMIRT